MLTTGKLCDFTVPSGYQVVWHTVLTQCEKMSVKGVLTTTTSGSGSTSASVSGSGSGSVSGVSGSGSGSNGEIIINTLTTIPSTPTNNLIPTLGPGSTSEILGTKIIGKGSVSVTHTNLPHSGFFGLDEVDIRGCIEALPNSESCVGYIFSQASEIRESLLSECKADFYRLNEKKGIDERLISLMLKERRYWQTKRDNAFLEMRAPYVPVRTDMDLGSVSLDVSTKSETQSVVVAVTADTEKMDIENNEEKIEKVETEAKVENEGSEVIIKTPSTSTTTDSKLESSLILTTKSESTPKLSSKSGFSPLFPSSFKQHESDFALSLWDFLDYSRPVCGDLSFTLHEIIKCIPKAESVVPTYVTFVFLLYCFFLTSYSVLSCFVLFCFI